MNKFNFQICCCFITVIFLIGCEGGKDSKHEVALRPFPRVGRRENPWNLAKLRDELFAFPRIGRSDQHFQVEEAKRTGPKPINNGLWFGPRLGRVSKRNLYVVPNLPEGYLLNPTDSGSLHYASRLGRDSDEDFMSADAMDSPRQQEPIQQDPLQDDS